jgi:multimeric flavodoxin WrbA
MKATLLNGARPGETDVDIIAAQVIDNLQGYGWEVQHYTLREEKIGYCIGCFGCWVKTPGECIIKDANQHIAEDIINSDLIVLVTPITFGGYSAELKRMVDHFIPLISPFFRRVNGETHHHKRYRHYPDLLAVGYQSTLSPRQADIFRRLVAANAVNLGEAQSTTLVIGSDEAPATYPSRIQQAIHTLEGTLS